MNAGVFQFSSWEKVFECDANSKEEEGCPKSSVAKLYFQFSNMFITCSQITFHGLCSGSSLVQRKHCLKSCWCEGVAGGICYTEQDHQLYLQ